MSKYWYERQQQLYAQLEKDEAKLNKKLAAYYDKQLAVLEKEIAAYYAKYGTDNVIRYKDLMLSLSDEDKQLLMEQMNVFAQKYPEYADLMPVRESIYKLNRLEGLQYSMQLQALELGAKEQGEIESHLQKWAEKSYTAAMGFGIAFNTVNTAIAKEIINSRWLNGKNFSDRIWANKDKLLGYLQTEFKNGVIRGDSYDKMEKELRRRMDVGKYEAKRLIYTEGTFVMNETAIQAFESGGYDQYKYSAINDSHTCELCSALNGQIFDLKDRRPGENFPPMHPGCRCGFEVVVDGIEKLGSGQSVVYPDTRRRELGYIDIDKKSNAEIYFGNMIRHEKLENCIAIESDGKVTHFIGNESGLSMSGLNYKGITLIHNHPESEGTVSFGRDDFEFIKANQDIEKLIAVNDEYTYSVEILKSMEHLVYNDYYRRADEFINDDDFELQHGVFRLLAKEGYVKYERKKINK